MNNLLLNSGGLLLDNICLLSSNLLGRLLGFLFIPEEPADYPWEELDHQHE